MTTRATARGEDRPPFEPGERADVLICGASFAGLAVARELAGTDADVLILDRYEIGERATSACAVPTPWMAAMGVEGATRQELPGMSFSTPHGRARYRLPWSWTAFDYKTLCELLWAQCGEARFATAVVHGRTGDTVHTDRGDVTAPLLVDAAGWRRVLGDPHIQPPEATLSRGLEVHPHEIGPHPALDLDLWIDRDLIRRGYGWSVPANGERRVGSLSYDPRDHVKEPTRAMARKLDVETVRYQGNWFPHALREATVDGAFCAGDSAGHCFPLSGEGIRTAFYFGIACGREIQAVLDGGQTREQALSNYTGFHERHRPAFTRAARLQRLIPALPPRLLAVLLRAMGVQPLVDRAFGWYLQQAHPSSADRPAGPRAPHGRPVEHAAHTPEHAPLVRALEDKLALAEARYRGLVEHVPAVAYVAEWDAHSTLTYVSPQIEELLGWPPEAFLADQDLWYRCIHPDDIARIREQERVAFEAGTWADMEFRMIARDGSERWVRDKEAVIRAADGTPRFSQGVLVDVTPTRATESELQDERHRAQRYLDIAGAIIVILDPAAKITLLNRAGTELLGYDEGELIGRDWYEAVVPERLRGSGRAAYGEELVGDQDDTVHESVVVTKDGEERTIAWRDTVVRDTSGAVTAIMSSGVDLTERRAAEEQIAYLAYHDPLTGLPNRALLQEHLDLALARARRQGEAVGLLYLDLDGFKLVNDSLGHPAGDELLCHVTLRLGERRRGMDLLARQGGDEFLLLLADMPRADAETHARRVAEDLLRSLAEPFSISGAEFHIGASIGISLYPRDAADADSLLRHADAAMYAAKAAGRNGVTVYSGDPHESLERLSMTSRLRKALDREELLLHWQPIVDPRDGALRKLEALVRWQDPFRGLVMPDDFIAFAEETGFVDRVGDWVVRSVRDQVLAWERAGYRPPRVTVNVSPRQLRRPDFGQRLLAMLTPDGVAGRFTVEITESAAMADPQRTDPVLTELVAAGIEVAIDDFGAGYSSLSRLRTMPVQVLKIDKTFLEDVPGDPEATAIVTAILELAGALGMDAVAEGVENEAQRAFLVERGCPLAQGFLLGRPVPAAGIEPLLARVGSGHAS